MRLSGLASGMDTDSMVESMMRVERMKVDKVEQNKQVSMWRQEAYNNTNKSFANFIINTKKDLGLNKTSSTGTITPNSYKNLDYVRRTTSSDDTKLGVSGGSKAVNGSYNIDVKNLAEGASFASKKITDENGNIPAGVIKDRMEFTIKINGKEKNIMINKPDGREPNMDDVVKAINSATIKDENNKDVSLGVSAFYDKSNGRLFMQTEKMGDGASIELVAGDRSKAFIKAIGYESPVKGKDASIEFNGVELKYDSNNIELNGINMELKAVGAVNVKVATNIDGMMEKIEKFVEDYNKLIDETSKTLGEKRYNSFHPLSQDEKKAMHDDDVTLWMEKAKSGMLNKDENINRTMQSMRSHIYKTVEGVEGSFKHITEIGITTERYSQGSAGGKLEIDLEKLRKALTDDPEGVMELLFKDKQLDGDGKEIGSEGVFTGIYTNLTNGMKSIIDKSGAGDNASLYRNVKSSLLLDFVTKKSSISDIDKAISDMDKRIDNLNTLLANKEDSYYAKFTQMEKYMQKMNSQSSWLSQQFMY